MKKKNLITTVASVAMVGVIAVGSTLAYLSANDGTLTNSFEFVQGNTTIDLWETNANKGETINKVGTEWADETGLTYENVVAGQKLEKHVHATVTTSVNSYVFVRLQNDTAKNGTDMLATSDMKVGEGNWIKLTGVEGVDNVYYQVYNVATSGTEETKDFIVFDHVTVPAGLDIESAVPALNDIKISSAAIQTEGFENAAAAYDQVKNLF